MSAIYKKEMNSYFTTPIGYIYLAVALGVSGFIFAMTTLMDQTSDLSNYFSFMIITYIVILPLLTMKTFAEEKKQHTEQLLLSSPVSLTSMVLGKAMAAFTMFMFTVVGSGLYFLALLPYGELNGGKLIGCLIGLMFVGMSFIAVGIFVSSLTENLFSAAVLTLGILIIFEAIGLLSNLTDVYVIRQVFDFLSVLTRYDNYVYGIFDIGSSVYYLSICGLFLFLTVRVYDKKRWN